MQVHQEYGKSLGSLLDLVEWSGAGEQNHQVGVLHTGDKYLLPVDDVFVSLAHGPGLQAGSIGAGIGFGDSEGLQSQLAASDLRQIAALLLVGAVAEHRPHGVHLRMRCPGVAAGTIDLLQNDGGFHHAKTGAVILFRNQSGQISRIGQRADEFLRVSPLAVHLAPVFVGILGAQLANASAQGGPYRRFSLCGGCNHRDSSGGDICRRPARARVATERIIDNDVLGSGNYRSTNGGEKGSSRLPR